MESKSPKEIQVEEKISDLVTKIVDGQTSGDDLPVRLWTHLRNHQEIAAMQNYANMVSIGRLGLNAKGIASDSENEVAMTTGLFI